MKKVLLKIFVWLLIAVIVVFNLIVLPYGLAMKPYSEYLRHKDVAVEVEANVSYIHIYEDSDDDKQYELYMTYTYDGVFYEDIYWETISSDKYEVGDSVVIKVLPENPAHIMSADIGARGIKIVMFVYAIVAVIVLYEKNFYSIKESSDKLFITDKMIANTLRPRGLLGISQALIFSGAGMYAAKLFMPELMEEITVANVLFAIGMAFFCIAVVKMLKLSEKGYSFGVFRCAEKWTDSDGDSTTYYTRFEYIEKTNHGGKVYDRAVVGNEYYIVQNLKGYIREIYDTKKWIPAVEDRSLKTGSKYALKRCCVELFLGSAFVFVFAWVFKIVANIIA